MREFEPRPPHSTHSTLGIKNKTHIHKMKTNQNLIGLIQELRKASHTEAPLWRRLASDLSGSGRAVNLSRINFYSKENETIVVPGKVLAGGNLDHKVTVAAYSFSKSAKDAITKSNGKALTIKELLSQNPKAKGVRIIG